MTRAYTTDPAPEEKLFEQRRQEERRQWFERVVMVPVSLGMLVAVSGYAANNILHAFNGHTSGPIEHAGTETAIASALVAFGAFLVSLLRWLRK